MQSENKKKSNPLNIYTRGIIALNLKSISHPRILFKQKLTKVKIDYFIRINNQMFHCRRV